MRGALVSLIYQKVTDAATRDAAAPSVVTLIETDVERICESWEFVVTDLWASVLQLGVAVYLLQRQIGAVCIAPVILTLRKYSKPVTTGR